VLDGGMADPVRIKSWLDELANIVAARNVYELVAKLKEIVPEYNPSPEILTGQSGSFDRFAKQQARTFQGDH
jgi:hypothetical protein